MKFHCCCVALKAAMALVLAMKSLATNVDPWLINPVHLIGIVIGILTLKPVKEWLYYLGVYIRQLCLLEVLAAKKKRVRTINSSAWGEISKQP